MLLSPCWVKHAYAWKDWMVEGWWSTYQQDEVLTLAGVSPGSGVLHQEVKMDLQEAVFWQGSISWGTQDPEDESSQAGGATTSRYRRIVKNWRTVWPWFMPRMLKPRSLKCNSRILKDVMRDFTSTEMIWQKNLRRTSTIERSHRRHEQDLKSLATLKIYWPLEDQTPVIYLR